MKKFVKAASMAVVLFSGQSVLASSFQLLSGMDAEACALLAAITSDPANISNSDVQFYGGISDLRFENNACVVSSGQFRECSLLALENGLDPNLLTSAEFLALNSSCPSRYNYYYHFYPAVLLHSFQLTPGGNYLQGEYPNGNIYSVILIEPQLLLDAAFELSQDGVTAYDFSSPLISSLVLSHYRLPTPNQDPVLLFEELIATIDSLDAKNGVKNSLTNKIESAWEKFDPTCAPHHQGKKKKKDNVNKEAIKNLQQFVDKVAKKSGKKLTVEDAELLSDKANELLILVEASCPL